MAGYLCQHCCTDDPDQHDPNCIGAPMGTKNHPGKFDCYEAADPDEPMFVLLGRDPLSPERVEEWARRRFERLATEHTAVRQPEREGHAERERITRQLHKIAEALHCANAMRDWHAGRRPQQPLGLVHPLPSTPAGITVPTMAELIAADCHNPDGRSPNVVTVDGRRREHNGRMLGADLGPEETVKQCTGCLRAVHLRNGLPYPACKLAGCHIHNAASLDDDAPICGER